MKPGGNNRLQDLTLNDVRLGDVVLSCGRANSSHAIRLLDGGNYSHAAICIGLNDSKEPIIVESTRDGVTGNLLEPDITNQEYVDVYRFKSDTGKTFLSTDWPAEPVIQRANYYKDQGAPYALNQLYLMSVLVFIRKAPLGKLGRANVRYWLDRMIRFYKEERTEPKEEFICSELVYRCFYEAEAKPRRKYGLTIRGTIGPDNRLAKTINLDNEASYPELNPDETKLLRQAEDLFRQFNFNLCQNSGQQVVLDAGPRSKAPNPNVFANTVTPGDLQRSPNLELMGRLRR